ncbi:hypothetical protein AGOR_G00235780 [Albula goreensis]|uniref:PHD-type domain-containing protein n=1 Tax=Albula goreensis TaxID=1534307 RepID=A0A8T3CJ05_9TELE|nr:hypothetical protein AGOR_G00235780 [Albula goreensis]
MELQGLQEALKVEIQRHQKLAVRSCPVGNGKPLSLINPSQSIAISVTPAKAAVSMVTAHMNGQKAPGPEPLQTAPAGPQAAGKAAGGGSPPPSRTAGEPPSSQMLGPLTAVPIKVPQVSSLTQLAVKAPAVLPQVRPKTQIPDSLPQSPAQEQQASRPPNLQGVTAMVSPRSPGPALSVAPPTKLANGRADSGTGAGVAYAIISASPTGPVSVSAVSEAVEVHPLLFSAESKVIIIQPQVPIVSQNSPEPQINSLEQETTPTPSPPANKMEEEDPEKITFMVALGLVTTEHLEEIQSKRQERKRRSTANPAYSGLLEPERKRLTSNYLNSPNYLPARVNEDLCWKEDLEHDEHCAVCKEEGELLPCHSCTRAYHPDCLYPPLKTPPKGAWHCPKCQKKVLNKDNMSWPQNFIQSYITHKTVRQEERRRLRRRNVELKKAFSLLEEDHQKLSQALKECMDVKSSLLGQQKDTQARLDRLRALIRLIQRDQVIQVTMMATTTTDASLLSLPWIKPTSTAHPAGTSMLLQKGLPQTQGNN